MNKVFTTLLAGSLLAGLACTGHANTVLSVTFAEDDGQPFAINYTQNGSEYSLSGSVGETITFSGPYMDKPGYVVPPNTPISTTLNFLATDSAPGSLGGGTALDMLSADFVGVGGPLNGVSVFSLTASGGLLTAAGTSGAVISNNSLVPAVDLLFGSDAIKTTPFIVSTESVTFALTLTSSAVYTPFPTGHLQPGFSALITGDLTVQVPTPPTTPEPGSVAFVVGALVSSTALLRRRRK